MRERRESEREMASDRERGGGVEGSVVVVVGGKREGQRRKARKQGNACRCRPYLVYKYANNVAFVICK